MADEHRDPVTVKAIDADGKVLSETVCPPDSYVITTGPRCHVTHAQVYPRTGTVQLTIKRKLGRK